MVLYLLAGGTRGSNEKLDDMFDRVFCTGWSELFDPVTVTQRTIREAPTGVTDSASRHTAIDLSP